MFIYILLTPSLFLVFFFQTASFLAEWNINPDAMATRGGLLPSPPKTTPSGQSPGSAKSQESKTPNSSERKIFLLQRKKGKLGAGLGRTTGWIHRATLNKGGVDMIGARLVYTLLSIYIYIYVYIARSLFLALARSRSLSLSLSGLTRSFQPLHSVLLLLAKASLKIDSRYISLPITLTSNRFFFL